MLGENCNGAAQAIGQPNELDAAPRRLAVADLAAWHLGLQTRLALLWTQADILEGELVKVETMLRRVLRDGHYAVTAEGRPLSVTVCGDSVEVNPVSPLPAEAVEIPADPPY